jgi:hypothetical protein
MRNIFGFETPHEMGYGVHLPYMAKETVAEPFPFAGPLDQSGDINEFHACLNHLLGFYKFDQPVEAIVRNRHPPHVGVNRAERKIAGRRAGGRKSVEEGGFADVGKADDSAVKTHYKIRGGTLKLRQPVGEIHSTAF